MLEIHKNKDFIWPNELITRLKTEPILDIQSGIELIPFDGTESPYYQKWFSDPEVLRYLHPKTPFTIDSNSRVSVEEFIDYMTNSPNFAYFRIVHPLYGFIGHVSMNGIDTNEMSFSRGCAIGEKEYWGQGIAKNVGRILIEQAKEVGFKKMTASCNVKNVASVKNLTQQFGEGTLTGDSLSFELNLA